MLLPVEHVGNSAVELWDLSLPGQRLGGLVANRGVGTVMLIPISLWSLLKVPAGIPDLVGDVPAMNRMGLMSQPKPSHDTVILEWPWKGVVSLCTVLPSDYLSVMFICTGMSWLV